jgi:hypothetical protein
MSTAPNPEKLARPRQIDELTPDQLVAALLRLAMEVSVLRDRLHSHELLLEKHDLLSTEAVDEFQAPPEATRQRQQASMELIEKLLGDLT